MPLLVDQANREAIEFRLDRIIHPLDAERGTDASIESLGLLVRECIVERQHRYPVGDRIEFGRRLTADALRR